MKLLLRLSFRELTNARKFSILFILNLALGIFGFILIHSFKDSVNTNLEDRAKILLGSDLSVGGRRPLIEQELKKLLQLLAEKVEEKTHVVQLYSMGKSLNSSRKSRLVQIKFIDDHYPLYGKLILQKLGDVDAKLHQKLMDSPLTWISQELAYQLKVKIGDEIKLGEKIFKVSAIIEEDSSTSWAGIGLAPKLYVSKRFQEATKLISFGSVASYSYSYKLKEDFQQREKSKKLKQQILKLIDDPAIRVALPDNSSEQVGRVLNYLTDYLGLVALVAIFLSGIGSSYLFQNFVISRMVDIGILKSLGMSLAQIKTLFSLQLIFLGGAGVTLAITIASFVLPLSSQLVEGVLSVPLDLTINLESMSVSLMVGIFIIFIICYPILKKLLSKNTIEMFHAESSLIWQWNKKDILNYLPLLFSIESLAVWQAHSIKVGTVFTLILIILVGVIASLLPLFMKMMNQRILKTGSDLNRPFSLSFGLALRELVRSRLSTILSFLSLSVGVTLLSLIGQLEVSLNHELLEDNLQRPSLFLFDIQSEQKENFVHFAKENNIPLMAPTPMVRSRIIKINGQKHERKELNQDFQTREDQQRSRFQNRGINLTYALTTNPSQTIVEGKQFSGVFSGEGVTEVSLENRYAQRLGVKLGDTLTFDILGVEVLAKVVSLRKIKWTSFLPNFFITLQPGVLEDAPQTFLAAVEKLDFKRQLQVQDLIVENFANISIINVSELIQKIMDLFKTMAMAIKIMALLCIAVGFFVIYAIIQNQIRKRAYDMALLKSFGASSQSLRKQFLFEYLILAMSATGVGAIFSLLAGRVLSQLFFDGVWYFDPQLLLYIFSGTFLLTTLVVSLSSRSIYKKRINTLLN